MLSAAEALDQRHGAGVCRFVGLPSLRNQVRGYASVDDAEHPAHDGRAG